MALSPKTVPDTILLKGFEQAIFHEAPAAATITPGHVVERDSNDKYALGGTATKLLTVAREDDLQGNGITDDYSANDNVLAFVPAPGSEVYMILADGENAARGADIQVAASGEVSVGTTNLIVGQAVAAVDASDSAATAVASRRIKVRIS